MIYTELTIRAMNLAYTAHHGQFDKGGVPYIFHPIHLAEQMDDEISTCVALLHDTVEDTAVTLEQLAAEFEEDLEERFDVRIDLSGSPPFAGAFDVQELRRIFNNLSSNVQKYASTEQPVYLNIRVDNGTLYILQMNSISIEPGQTDSYKLGINSIRRIVQNYSGSVSVQQDAESFSITITLSDF